ncbi:MAG: serine/threonine-protein kinase [Myxococcales bacterium]|nr:serine/threonine-protein kinase [Myxococcales bacterium]
MSFARGATIGEYEIVKALGSGGMGEVFEAVHPIIHKRVAIKVMRRAAHESLTEARRLLEEARAVNSIRHPGIIDIFGANVLPDGRPYLVMELLEGQSLHDFIKTNQPLSLGDVFGLLEGILAPLAAAHRAGVIHRDLKPTNIFVARGPSARTVKLLDFGVALRREREPLTAPEMTLGSLGFMSPEQLNGATVAQSDLYSVGCIAWLLITGRPVFAYGNVMELARHHLLTRPPPIGSVRGEVTAALEEWVASMLEKEPSARPGSANEALSRLKEVQEQLASETTVRPGTLRALMAQRADQVPIDEVETRRLPILRGPVPRVPNAPHEAKTLHDALRGPPPSAPADDADDDLTIKIDSPKGGR